MKKFISVIFSALLMCATLWSCGDKGPSNQIEGGFINVFPTSLTFHADGKIDNNSLAIVSSTSWSISMPTTASWVTLSATSGNKKGEITVEVAPAKEGEGEKYAELTFTTTNEKGEHAKQLVMIKRGTTISADELTLTADFQTGAQITTPELPPYSTDNFTTGRHLYTIQNHTFAIFADKEMGGKFYWIDNTVFQASLPTPNKGLFFSKLGAYIEFPSIEGLSLTDIQYIPTTSQSSEVMFDLQGSNGDYVAHTVSILENGGSNYKLLSPATNRAYRLVTENDKNAQCAELVLTYKRL